MKKIIFCLIGLIIFLVSPFSFAEDSGGGCGAVYDPVCAYTYLEACQGGGVGAICIEKKVYETFSNECELGFGQGYTYAYDGECTIQSECTDRGDAVCGYTVLEACQGGGIGGICIKEKIYETFSSTCEMVEEGYNFQDNGECVLEKECVDDYEPVCGRAYSNCGGTTCPTYNYKTFDNTCKLMDSTESYNFYEYGECSAIDNIITVDGPSSVVVGENFQFQWSTEGLYDYCVAIGDNIKYDNGEDWLESITRPGLEGDVTLVAPESGTSVEIGVECYYMAEGESDFSVDEKTLVIDLEQGSGGCGALYEPVCGRAYSNCGGTTCPTYTYKTFGNECELLLNTEGYDLYEDGKCENIDNIITVDGPSSVVVGENFQFQWNTEGLYDYCVAIGDDIEYDDGEDWLESITRPGLEGDVTLVAPESGTSVEIGVECYYMAEGESDFSVDEKTLEIDLEEDSGGCGGNYDPVCGREYIDCDDDECSKYMYETFFNDCELEQNDDYSFFRDGDCDDIENTLELEGPASVSAGDEFVVEWNAKGLFEYCVADGDSIEMVGGEKWLSYGDELGIKGRVVMIAPEEGYEINVGLKCYYAKEGRSYLKILTKNLVIELEGSEGCGAVYEPVCGYIQPYCFKSPCPKYYKTFPNECSLEISDYKYSYEGKCSSDDEQCIELGEIGPNSSLGTEDPNYGRSCCVGLTAVNMPEAYNSGKLILEGLGTVCAKVGDGECDARYEVYGNSEDCKSEEDSGGCGGDYDPVCGVDGKTYPNACSAQDVKINYIGKCLDYTPTDKEDIVLLKVIEKLQEIAERRGNNYVLVVLYNIQKKVFATDSLRHQYYIQKLITPFVVK